MLINLSYIHFVLKLYSFLFEFQCVDWQQIGPIYFESWVNEFTKLKIMLIDASIYRRNIFLRYDSNLFKFSVFQSELTVNLGKIGLYWGQYPISFCFSPLPSLPMTLKTLHVMLKIQILVVSACIAYYLSNDSQNLSPCRYCHSTDHRKSFRFTSSIMAQQSSHL